MARRMRFYGGHPANKREKSTSPQLSQGSAPSDAAAFSPLDGFADRACASAARMRLRGKHPRQTGKLARLQHQKNPVRTGAAVQQIGPYICTQ